MTDPARIRQVLERGVEDVLVRESLEKKMLSGRALRVKLGIDPTSPNIHIGRAITLRKLRAFQDLGHIAVMVIGDFTAQVGDPSDKLAKRPMLAAAQIKENLRDYKKIIGKIIDLDRAEFHFNSKWLAGLTFAEICQLAESFTVQQMTERRNFKDRIEKGEEVSLREFMYPLMQGYDSVPLRADVELGGFDQLFNVKAGRVIQKHYGLPQQDVLVTAMLEGTDGRKMSSSWGNVINVTDAPNDMYGKIMSLRDDLITRYFLLCTDVSEGEVERVEAAIKAGENPKQHKAALAREVVAIYHGAEAATAAEAHFTKVFTGGAMPADTKQVKVAAGTKLGDILVAEKIVASKSEFRRLVEQGGVHLLRGASDETVKDPMFAVSADIDVKVGARRFLKVRLI